MIYQTETIEVFKAGGMWMAKHSNPKVFELFGTDTIPTPYSDKVSEAGVVRMIADRNLDCRVFPRPHPSVRRFDKCR